MSDWLQDLREQTGRTPLAMISVLATEGSAPRGAGTRMLVTDDRLFGTIGGGTLEYRAVDQARSILRLPPGSWRVQDYPLGPLLGQCCGGRVRLLIEHVDPDKMGWLGQATEGATLVSTLADMHIDRHISPETPISALAARGDRPGVGVSFAERIGEYRRPVYLFGAGHVGQAIARHATKLPFRLAWFDSRPLFEAIEGVTVIPEMVIDRCVVDAPDDAAILILTHDHGLDYSLTRAALQRPPLAFVGLIGSTTKRARFLSRLERDGVDAAARARLTCPIGVEGVLGKEPDVIAIAALAQLLCLPRVAGGVAQAA